MAKCCPALQSVRLATKIRSLFFYLHGFFVFVVVVVVVVVVDVVVVVVEVVVEAVVDAAPVATRR